VGGPGNGAEHPSRRRDREAAARHRAPADEGGRARSAGGPDHGGERPRDQRVRRWRPECVLQFRAPHPRHRHPRGAGGAGARARPCRRRAQCPLGRGRRPGHQHHADVDAARGRADGGRWRRCRNGGDDGRPAGGDGKVPCLHPRPGKPGRPGRRAVPECGQGRRHRNDQLLPRARGRRIPARHSAGQQLQPHPPLEPRTDRRPRGCAEAVAGLGAWRRPGAAGALRAGAGKTHRLSVGPEGHARRLSAVRPVGRGPFRPRLRLSQERDGRQSPGRDRRHPRARAGRPLCAGDEGPDSSGKRPCRPGGRAAAAGGRQHRRRALDRGDAGARAGAGGRAGRRPCQARRGRDGAADGARPRS